MSPERDEIHIDLPAAGCSRKRSFNSAFPSTEEESNKRTKSHPTNDAQKTNEQTEDLGDIGALLLVAFANQTSPSPAPSQAISSPTSRRPSSPSISEDSARSDSGSDITLTNSSQPLSNHVSDNEIEEEDDDEGSESEEAQEEEANKFGAATMMRRRLRVGQHHSRRRHRTTTEQLRVLELTYAGNKVPNQELRKDLANQLGMTTRRVQIWFQNKRAKEKRLRQENPSHKPAPALLPASITTDSDISKRISLAAPSLPNKTPNTSSILPNNIHTPAPALQLGSIQLSQLSQLGQSIANSTHSSIASEISSRGAPHFVANAMPQFNIQPIPWQLYPTAAAMYYPSFPTMPNYQLQTMSPYMRKQPTTSMWTSPIR